MRSLAQQGNAPKPMVSYARPVSVLQCAEVYGTAISLSKVLTCNTRLREKGP